MSTLRRLGLSSYLYNSVFLVVLQVTYALELLVPSQVTAGGTVSIQWLSVPSDPPGISIRLVCNADVAMFSIVPPVSTNATEVEANIPPPQSFLSLNLSFPLSCNFEALSAGNVVITLNEVPVEVVNSTTTTPTKSLVVPSVVTPLPLVFDTTSNPRQKSASMNTISRADVPSGTSLSESTQRSTSSLTIGLPPDSTTSHSTTTTSEPRQTHTTPTGAIVGGVVGGLIGLGILVIFVIVCLRRRRRPPPPPRPLSYDQNYVQPLDKSGKLAQLADEREAVRRQRDQLQTEVESMHLRESVHDETSNIGVLERKIEALSQRIFELERQAHDDQSPPSYSNLSSSL